MSETATATQHTPGPWMADKAKWGACQWGCWENAERAEPNLAGGVLPCIAYYHCKDNDDHDWAIRPRRYDQQEREIPHGEQIANFLLMAAAPELLACLIEMASGHSMAGEARARAAIAKATGNA